MPCPTDFSAIAAESRLPARRPLYSGDNNDDEDRNHSCAQRRPAPEPHHRYGLDHSRFAALGAEAVARIVKTIAVYDDFCHANDPYEEHDFGSFEVDGHKLFFKIDSVTERVITIMLAEEY